MTVSHMLVKRFMSKVKVTSSCWIWTGHVTKGGYGQFRMGNKTIGAHVAAYRIFRGHVPPGMDVEHACHTRDEDCPGGVCLHRRCVNPLHLEAVTRRENLLRGRGVTGRNAKKTHCPVGHELNTENTIRYRGWRSCRTCHNDRSSEYGKRKRREARV